MLGFIEGKGFCKSREAGNEAVVEGYIGDDFEEGFGGDVRAEVMLLKQEREIFTYVKPLKAYEGAVLIDYLFEQPYEVALADILL